MRTIEGYGRRVWLIVGLISALFALAIGAFVLLSSLVDGDFEENVREDMSRSGAGVIAFLARQPAISGTNITSEALKSLPAQLGSLTTMCPWLRSVRVTEGGAPVFEFAVAKESDDSLPVVENVKVNDEIENLGSVEVFKSDVVLHDGSSVTMEVAIDRPGSEKRAEVKRLFRFGALVILVCAVATLAVILRYEYVSRRRLAKERQEEHILYSGMLANSIVHDFRNPMSSVKLDAQMLVRESRREGGGDHDRISKLSERISKTLGRMDDIFKEFLFLSKPASVTKERFDLYECISSCVEMFTAKLEAGGITCRLDSQLGAIPAYASESAVRRAVMNVVTNAIQHSPSGGTIEIVVEDSGYLWQVDVRDRGPGIAENMREKVFEMFFTTRSAGTGLGLFMARAALINCGGSIVALGREGGGCVIRMTVPKAAPDGVNVE